MKKNNYLVLCTFLSMTLLGCNQTSKDSESVMNTDSSTNSSEMNVSDSSQSDSVAISSSSEEDTYGYEVDETFDFETHGFRKPSVETMTALPSYVPTTFDTKTYKTTKQSLSEGVDMFKIEYTLNGGSTIKPYCVVVDLKQANIVAGSYNNTTSSTEFAKRSVPFQQAQAWNEANPTKKFLAVTNADFFGETCVNAFVKDGVIMKSAHNYDLNDVPESKPMLFGVSSEGARIAPMTSYDDYEKNLAGKLSKTGLSIFSKEGTLQGIFSYGSDTGLINSGYSIITTKSKKSIPSGNKVYLFKKIQNDLSSNDIKGCIVEDATGSASVKLESSLYGYLVVGSQTESKCKVGDYIAIAKDTVISPGGMWNYYDTILGCRHSLIENGVLPATLSKESSNGAANRVPRTAVGIMEDGKVVIVSVEDLHYNSELRGDNPICSGLSLTELADFMRYFGCYDAANFDGGGSSQLITNINGSYVVQTRSSDTGSTALESTRSVLNTIIVTTK